MAAMASAGALVAVAEASVEHRGALPEALGVDLHVTRCRRAPGCPASPLAMAASPARTRRGRRARSGRRRSTVERHRSRVHGGAPATRPGRACWRRGASRPENEPITAAELLRSLAYAVASSVARSVTPSWSAWRGRRRRQPARRWPWSRRSRRRGNATVDDGGAGERVDRRRPARRDRREVETAHAVGRQREDASKSAGCSIIDTGGPARSGSTIASRWRRRHPRRGEERGDQRAGHSARPSSSKTSVAS